MPFLHTRYNTCTPSQDGYCIDNTPKPTTLQIVAWLIFGVIGFVGLIALVIIKPHCLRVVIRSCLDVFRGKAKEKERPKAKGGKGDSNPHSGGLGLSVSGLAFPATAGVDIGKSSANIGVENDHGAGPGFYSRLYSNLFSRFGWKGKGKEEKEAEVGRSGQSMVGSTKSLEPKMDNRSEGGQIASSKLYSDAGLGVAKYPVHITLRRASSTTDDESLVATFVA